ncbi:unnamed protein product [Heterobilharzia americana]|nr:unnamed protein product [Heterobilharzia americana]CAH8629166.1 unnamed protein product [Heterobilharzia americana]
MEILIITFFLLTPFLLFTATLFTIIFVCGRTKVKRATINTVPNPASNHVPRTQPIGTTDFATAYPSQTPYPVGQPQGGMPTSTVATDQPPPYPTSTEPPLEPPPPPSYYSKVPAQ